MKIDTLYTITDPKELAYIDNLLERNNLRNTQIFEARAQGDGKDTKLVEMELRNIERRIELFERTIQKTPVNEPKRAQTVSDDFYKPNGLAKLAEAQARFKPANKPKIATKKPNYTIIKWNE